MHTRVLVQEHCMWTLCPATTHMECTHIFLAYIIINAGKRHWNWFSGRAFPFDSASSDDVKHTHTHIYARIHMTLVSSVYVHVCSIFLDILFVVMTVNMRTLPHWAKLKAALTIYHHPQSAMRYFPFGVQHITHHVWIVVLVRWSFVYVSYTLRISLSFGSISIECVWYWERERERQHQTTTTLFENLVWIINVGGAAIATNWWFWYICYRVDCIIYFKYILLYICKYSAVQDSILPPKNRIKLWTMSSEGLLLTGS